MASSRDVVNLYYAALLKGHQDLGPSKKIQVGFCLSLAPLPLAIASKLGALIIFFIVHLALDFLFF
jgi:hypothetical protein